MSSVRTILCLAAVVALALVFSPSADVSADPGSGGSFNLMELVDVPGPSPSVSCYDVYCDGSYAGQSCGRTLEDIVDYATFLCNAQ